MENSDNKKVGTLLTGPGFKAKLKFYHCQSSYDCIAACPELAITKGADRFSSMACLSAELAPGKAEVHPEKCTGCGNAFQLVRTTYWKWCG